MSRSGAAAYLVKPVGREELLTALATVGAPVRTHAPGHGARGERMSQSRILVVEDNPKNLKLVRDVLTYSGYEVIEATRARTASGWRTRASPDLILMDLQLPGIDGAEALRQIRTSRRTARSRWSR